MNPQLDLLSRGTARTDDPDTSKEAGAKANELRATQEAAILDALAQIGLPATASRIAQQLGWMRGNQPDNVAVSRRLAAMRDRGAIYSFDGKHGRPLLREDGQCKHIVAQRAA